MDAAPSTRSHHREHVLFASLALILLFAQWRTISAPLWSVRDPLAVTALTAVFWLGWTLVQVSTFLIERQLKIADLETRSRVDELVYESCPALNAQDWDGFLALCDPDAFRYPRTTGAATPSIIRLSKAGSCEP